MNPTNISENVRTEGTLRQKISDTTSVSSAAQHSSVTYKDSLDVIARISNSRSNLFPYSFLEKNRAIESAFRASLEKRLKDGEKKAERPFHDDWIILIILFASFFYSSVQNLSRKLFPDVVRFFLFRGVGEAGSRETSELFHWQSTLINLISFFNLALFMYCAAWHYGLIPDSPSHFISWLIASGIVIASVTLRHIVSYGAGILSGRKEIFDEYLITIYQSYRYLALLYFILVILLCYTSILPPGLIIFSGLVSFSVLYLMRVLRLFLIFNRRNVSVLYLILYLCALEFLPVVVVIKFITG